VKILGFCSFVTCLSMMRTFQNAAVCIAREVFRDDVQRKRDGTFGVIIGRYAWLDFVIFEALEV